MRREHDFSNIASAVRMKVTRSPATPLVLSHAIQKATGTMIMDSFPDVVSRIDSNYRIVLQSLCMLLLLDVSFNMFMSNDMAILE